MDRTETFEENEEITVGMTITLKNGPLKGYKGVVKSINK
jgi:transcription antitermination factor NusG